MAKDLDEKAIRRDHNHITLKETTALAKKLDFNLDGFKSTKYFYSDLFIIEEPLLLVKYLVLYRMLHFTNTISM